jgi:hypothetical protein
MRKYRLIFVVWLCSGLLLSFAQADDPHVALSGRWRCSLDYQAEEITISGEVIENTSASDSDALKLVFLLTKNEYHGGSIEGWSILENEYVRLEKGYQYEGIAQTKKFGDQPASGNYYVVILLLEKAGSSYGIADSLCLDGMISFSNTIEPKIQRNLEKIRNLENERDAMPSSIVPIYIDPIMSFDYYSTLLSVSLSRLDEIQSELMKLQGECIALGYSFPGSLYPRSYIPDAKEFITYGEIQARLAARRVAPPVEKPYSSYVAPLPTPPLNSGSSYKDPSYGLMLQRDLADAQRSLAFAQEQFDWAVRNNSSTIMASMLLNSASQQYHACQQRLMEYNSR